MFRGTRPEVPGHCPGRGLALGERASGSERASPELRARAPEGVWRLVAHLQPMGSPPPGIPNLGTPTFAGKSSDPEIPPPMEAAGIGKPRKKLPRGAGPLLGWLANLRKANRVWLVYNTI